MIFLYQTKVKFNNSNIVKTFMKLCKFALFDEI